MCAQATLYMPITPIENSVLNMLYPLSLRKVFRSELSKERGTRLEGRFDTQKEPYSLSRIKVRNRKTEILWIFFEYIARSGTGR